MMRFQWYSILCLAVPAVIGNYLLLNYFQPTTTFGILRTLPEFTNSTTTTTTSTARISTRTSTSTQALVNKSTTVASVLSKVATVAAKTLAPFVPTTTPVSATKAISLPYCKVLIESNGHEIEFIESVIAQFEFDRETTSLCDTSVLEFSIEITGYTKLWGRWSRSWETYAKRELVKRNFTAPDGSVRRVQPLVRNGQYHLFIRNNCTCSDADVDWVHSSPNHYGFLMSNCSRLTNRAVSIHPNAKSVLVPNHLPPVTSNPNLPYNKTANFCALHEDANLLRLVSQFLFDSAHLSPEMVQFHFLTTTGVIVDAPRMRQFASRFQIHSVRSMDYPIYIRRLYETCDVMISVTDDVSGEQWASLKSLAIAKAYNKPLLLHQRVAALYHNFLPNSTITHSGDSVSFSTALRQVMKQLGKPESSAKSNWLPPCQVLLDNHYVAYHYFLLESIVAEYPLPPLNSCNQSRMEFTIAIMKGANEFQRERSRSWRGYADRHIRNRIYMNGYNERVVVDIFGSKSTPREPYHYIINATCRCDDATKAWLADSANAYCVFHEKCAPYADSVHAAWLSPMHKRFFFPNLLPTFDYPRNTSKTVNLCVIGHPSRRNYDLLAKYLAIHPTMTNETLKIHNLGWGPVPPVMEQYQHFVSFYTVAGFVEYQKVLYDLCDGIIGLMTKSSHPYYFPDSEQKLTGIVCHASAYKKPILIHEELATLYRPYLGDVVEVHNERQGSFDRGLDRLISALNGTIT